MNIKNRVALSISVILLSASFVNASIQIKPSFAASPSQTQELEKLQREKEIRDRVQVEVDRAFGNTTTLLNTLLMLLTALPVIAAVFVWLLRRSVINQIVSETQVLLHKEVAKQLEKEVEISVKQEVAKQLEKEVAEELKHQTTDVQQKIQMLTSELSELFELQKVIAEELKQQKLESQQEIERLTAEFIDEMSQLQLSKNNLMQQLNMIIPSSTQIAVIPEESFTQEEHKKIEELAIQLEVLQEDNPQLSFSANDYLKQGDALFLARRYEEAIKYYDRVIKEGNNPYIALVNRGRALRRLGRYEEALLSYDAAIKIKDDDYIAWFGRGNALKSLQRYDEAINCFEKVLKLQPGFDLTLYNKARTHALKGDIDLALTSLDMAINSHPEKYWTLLKLAKNESDFDGIKKDERFQRLIGN